MATPLVTVICTTYNHEKYIRDALNGFVLQKTTFPFKVIVQDDASTDGTASIIREYEAKHPLLFHCIYHQVNQYQLGVNKFRKFIEPLLGGKYVAYCEGDDYWIDKNKLQREIDYMEAHPDCSQCCHAYNKIRANDKALLFINRSAECERDLTPEELIMYNNPPQLCTQVFKREVVEFDMPCTALAKVGDYPLLLKSLLFGNVHYIDEVMSSYRVRADGSWSQRVYARIEKQSEHKQNIIVFLEAFNEYTEFKYNKPIKQKLQSIRFKVAMLNQHYAEARKCEWYSCAERTEKIEITTGRMSPKLAQFFKRIFRKTCGR